MHLFGPDNSTKTPRHAKLYASFEVLHTIVDFLAATLFIIGSVLFFSEETQIPATWCFLIGSICFALKPSLRLIRELRLANLKDTDSLAARAPEK
jgi:hypothetical protein